MSNIQTWEMTSYGFVGREPPKLGLVGLIRRHVMVWKEYENCIEVQLTNGQKYLLLTTMDEFCAWMDDEEQT